MSRLRPLLAAFIALPLLTACNTIEGLGQDVQAVGRGVSSAAGYVEREVFSPAPVRTAQSSVRVGSACDASGLAGGSSLPPCRSQITRPGPSAY